MTAKFDIFKRLPDGHPIWVKAVDGLDEAKRQLARLTASSSDEYFIYNIQKGCVIQSEASARA
jgi:hypothetical protein